MRQKKLLIILHLLFTVISLNAQKYVSDSLVVSFGTLDLQKINAVVDTIYDLRKLKPNCINLTERTKFSIPVDYYIVTKRNLANEIRDMFSQIRDSLHPETYCIELKEFEIKSNSQPLGSSYNCNSIVSIYTLDPKKVKHYSGTLLYEIHKSAKNDKKHPEKIYEEAIDYWKYWFSSDMNAIRLRSGDSTFYLPNFRRESGNFKKSMIISSEIAVGIGVWMVDGEILFSRPEVQRIFYRQGNILRYRHEKKFDSFETAITNKQVNFRLNDNFIFNMKSKLFLGLNRWNNNEFSKHTFQDVFLFDFSVNQTILYNPYYKHGIVGGIGVMEDATYIYSQRFKFNAFVVAVIGIKL